MLIVANYAAIPGCVIPVALIGRIDLYPGVFGEKRLFVPDVFLVVLALVLVLIDEVRGQKGDLPFVFLLLAMPLTQHR